MFESAKPSPVASWDWARSHDLAPDNPINHLRKASCIGFGSVLSLIVRNFERIGNMLKYVCLPPNSEVQAPKSSIIYLFYSVSKKKKLLMFESSKPISIALLKWMNESIINAKAIFEKLRTSSVAFVHWSSEQLRKILHIYPIRIRKLKKKKKIEFRKPRRHAWWDWLTTKP